MKLVIVYLVASVGLVAETVLYQAAAIHTADRGTIENGQLLVQGQLLVAIARQPFDRARLHCKILALAWIVIVFCLWIVIVFWA